MFITIIIIISSSSRVLPVLREHPGLVDLRNDPDEGRDGLGMCTHCVYIYIYIYICIYVFIDSFIIISMISMCIYIYIYIYICIGNFTSQD